MAYRRFDTEFFFNILLSISIAFWAVFGLCYSSTIRPLFVRICITALHLIVATQILGRTPLRQSGSSIQFAMAIPALLIGGWIFYHSPQEWDPISQLVFGLGTLIACWSFLYLGKSFSILPAIRMIVKQGPYSFVRHPAYLGELIMVGGCCLATMDLQYLLYFPVALLLVVLRIQAEETLLSSQSQYREYQTKVRYRLLPGIW